MEIRLPLPSENAGKGFSGGGGGVGITGVAGVTSSFLLQELKVKLVIKTVYEKKRKTRVKSSLEIIMVGFKRFGQI
ncbi:MAG TPA: hypothetical protein DCX54_07470 [Flavobacteriales bacterium]|nr:hypothetical protein [Flavobacteriales bacterium]